MLSSRQCLRSTSCLNCCISSSRGFFRPPHLRLYWAMCSWSMGKKERGLCFVEIESFEYPLRAYSRSTRLKELKWSHGPWTTHMQQPESGAVAYVLFSARDSITVVTYALFTYCIEHGQTRKIVRRYFTSRIVQRWTISQNLSQLTYCDAQIHFPHGLCAWESKSL